MGKSNAQRSKGNTKPASSARSAQILGGATGFIGFCGVEGANFVSASLQYEDDLQVASEFRICLKAMSKKDSVTKIKALQEFMQLCQSEDKKNTKTTLPFWPRIYSQVSSDPDWKVREAAQLANKVLCAELGKYLAPQLRHLMPTWLLAMNDPYDNIAVSAKTSFYETFSESKRADVFNFCSGGILDHICDNLIIQTPMMRKTKNMTPDHCQQIHDIMVCCSLRGLSQFIKTIPTFHETTENLAKLELLLKNKRFWAYGSHNNPQIRCSWYQLMYELIDVCPELMQKFTPEESNENQSILVKQMIHALSEKNTGAAIDGMRAFLIFAQKFKSELNSYDDPTSLGKNVCQVVSLSPELGLYNNLVVLLSVLPSSVTTNEFYVEFFRGFLSSDPSKFPRRDSIRMREMIAAFLGCIKLKRVHISENTELLDAVVKQELFHMIKSSWGDFPILRQSKLAHHLTQLMLATSDCPLISDTFWKEFVELTRTAITNADVIQLEVLCEFYAEMKMTLKDNQKELQSVSMMVAPLIKLSYDLFNEGKNTFDTFACLLSRYPSADAYSLLLGEVKENHRELIIRDILEPLVQKGLKYSLDGFYEIFESLYQHFDESTKMNVLQNPRIMSWGVMMKMVSKLVRSGDPTAKKWFRSAAFGYKMVKAAEQLHALILLDDGTETSNQEILYMKQLLLLVFSSGKTNELMFTSDCISKILCVFLSMMLPSETFNLTTTNQSILKLVYEFAYALIRTKVCWDISTFSDLICLLFRGWCYSEHDSMAEPYKLVKLTIQTFCKSTDDVTKTDGFVHKLVQETISILKSMDCTFDMSIDISSAWVNMIEDLPRPVAFDIFKLFCPSDSDISSSEADFSSGYVLDHVFSTGIHLDTIPPGKSAQCLTDLKHVKRSLVNIVIFKAIGTENQTDSVLAQLIAFAAHCTWYADKIFPIKSSNIYSHFEADIKSGIELMHTTLNCILSNMKQDQIKLLLLEFVQKCSDSVPWRVSLYNVLNYSVSVDQWRSYETELYSKPSAQSIISLASSSNVTGWVEPVADGLANLTIDSSIQSLIEISLALPRVSLMKVSELLDTVFQAYFNWQDTSKQFYNHISKDWQKSRFHLASLQLFTNIVKHADKHVAPAQWDLMLCSVTQWSQQIQTLSKDAPTDPVVALLVSGASKLCAVLCDVIVSPNKGYRPPLLEQEWENVYSAPLYKIFFGVLVRCVPRNFNRIGIVMSNVLTSLSMFLATMNAKTILSDAVPDIHDYDDPISEKLNPQMQSVLRHLIPMLSVPNWGVQTMAYTLLHRIMPETAAQWKNNIPIGEPEDDDLPMFIVESIQKAQTNVQYLRPEDFLEENTDKYAQFHCNAYFLSFHILLRWCYLVPEHLEFYQEYLRQTDLIANLLNFLFRVSPIPISLDRKTQWSSFKFEGEEFNIVPDNKNIAPSKRHEIVGCRLFQLTFSGMRPLIHDWFLGLERVVKKNVEDFMKNVITPILVLNEFQSVDDASELKQACPNMTIANRTGPREISASYRAAGTDFEIRLVMPSDYPLSLLQIQIKPNLDGNSKKSFLDQFTKSLMRYNWSLAEVMKYLYKHLERKLGGDFEECCICYYIVHFKTHELPTSVCHVCKKRFHAICLYKWISQPGSSSTCPMCRSPI